MSYKLEKWYKLAKSIFSVMHAKSLQLCPTLCDPMYCSPPGSSVHGILQPSWSGFLCLPPEDLPNPGIELMSLQSSVLASGFLPLVLPGKPYIINAMACKQAKWYKLAKKVFLVIKTWGSFFIVTFSIHLNGAVSMMLGS